MEISGLDRVIDWGVGGGGAEVGGIICGKCANEILTGGPRRAGTLRKK